MSSLFALPEAHSTIDVDVHSLDDLLGPGRDVDVVKIDVEGAELDVLRGMKRILADNEKAVVILEYGPSHLKRVGIEIQSWFAAIREYGFDIWEIDDESLSLRPLRKAGLDELYSINLLLARGRPEALEPLFSGADFMTGQGREVIVVGAGGHSKVVIDVLRASGWQPAGLLDRDATAGSVLGVPVLGDDDLGRSLYEDGYRNAFVAIGRNDLRRRLGTRLRDIGFTIVTTHSSERHDFTIGDHRRRGRDHAPCDHQCRRQDRRFRNHQHRGDRRARLHHWGGGACRAALCYRRGSDDRGRGLIRDWSSRTAAQRDRRRFDGRSWRGGGRQCSTAADRDRYTGAAVTKHVTQADREWFALMKIGLVSSTVPLVQGGGRFIVDWLADKLAAAGHRVETVWIPFTDEVKYIFPQMTAFSPAGSGELIRPGDHVSAAGARRQTPCKDRLAHPSRPGFL